jgi:hypothetical protein
MYHAEDSSPGPAKVQLPEIPSVGLTCLMNRFILSQVRTRLRFIWQNDPAVTQQDLCCDLQRKALAASRSAALKGYTELHRSHCMRVAITNCSNVAAQRGNVARCPLQRQHQATRQRAAWLVDTEGRQVLACWVSLQRRHRRGDYVLVKFQGACQFRHLQRLYETQQEAEQGLQRFVQLGDGKRQAIIDLTADHDDFRASTISLDTPLIAQNHDGSPMTRHDLVAGQPPVDLGLSFASITDPRARQCLDLLLHRCDDPVFTQFCRQRFGEDPAQLGDRALLRRAMQFSGIDLKEMRVVLRRLRPS